MLNIVGGFFLYLNYRIGEHSASSKIYKGYKNIISRLWFGIMPILRIELTN